MAYTRLHWVESETPLSAENFNNIEDGIQELQNTKVDKVSGKDLSDNNYTSAEKTKLAGIAAGAEVNVQSDWNQNDSGADDFIKNKPGNASTSVAGFMSAADKSKLNGIETGATKNTAVATTSANGLMSSSDKSKLNGIQAGAQVNPGAATTSANGLMSKEDKSKLNGIESGANNFSIAKKTVTFNVSITLAANAQTTVNVQSTDLAGKQLICCEAARIYNDGSALPYIQYQVMSQTSGNSSKGYQLRLFNHSSTAFTIDSIKADIMYVA